MRYFFVVLFSCTSFLILAQQSPCSTEQYKEFHFWVGEWDVTQNGKPAGTNNISLEQGTCLMVERWTSATPPYTGSSYNYYDVQTGKWVQVWVDNGGFSLRTTGDL